MVAYFEDTGLYYANQEMVNREIVLSVGSGLIYYYGKPENVTIIKKATDEFLDIAKKDIDADGPCFYSYATILSDDNGKLVWELYSWIMSSEESYFM